MMKRHNGPDIRLSPTEGHRTGGPGVPDQTGGDNSQAAPTGSPNWQTETDGRIRDVAAVDRSTIYVGDHDGILHAFDRDTGTRRWRSDLETVRVHGPSVVGETVYAASGEALMAFDAGTGDRRWTIPERRIMERPIVSDGTAIFYAVDRNGWRLLAVDTTSNKVSWSHEEGYDTDTQLQSNIHLTDDFVTAATWSALRAFERDTGEPAWSVPHRGSIEWIDSDETLVYCGSRTKGYTPNVLAIEPDTGEVRWRAITRGDEWITGITVVDDRLLASGIEAEGDGTKTRTVTALSKDDGEILWRNVTNRSESSMPPRPVAVTDYGIIATGGRYGTVLSVETGAIIGRIDFGTPVHAEPVVVDDVLYVGNDGGVLTAHELS